MDFQQLSLFPEDKPGFSDFPGDCVRRDSLLVPGKSEKGGTDQTASTKVLGLDGSRIECLNDPFHCVYEDLARARWADDGGINVD